jgi:hypothetical protein
MMEVIHSPGAASFNQQGRYGAVENFLIFNSFVRIPDSLPWKIRINIFAPLAGKETG